MSIANPIAPPAASTGFAYSRDRFQQLVEDALAFAKTLGATDAGAEVSEGVGLSVSVRKGEVENVERNRDKSIGVSVYIGKRRGNASTSDFSRTALEQTVRAAYDIARFTAEDPAAGLPEEADLAHGDTAARDLDLFHPWGIDAEGAVDLAARCERAALVVDRRITNSEGAGVSAQQSSFLLDSLGKAVLPEHIDIHEDPHVPRGKGSAPFDDEGVVTRVRDAVLGGVVQGYFLSSYSARKLGMHTTGHAGGSQNLRFTSRRTQPSDDLDAM